MDKIREHENLRGCAEGMLIRTEEPGDFDIVRELVRLSFKDIAWCRCRRACDAVKGGGGLGKGERGSSRSRPAVCAARLPEERHRRQTAA